MDDLEFLGAALSLLRRRSGRMQKDIADKTGMSRSQVSRYERGRDTPNLVTLVRYLTTIGSDFQELHDALQEARALASGATEAVRPDNLRAFEKALTLRLPLAPELREALYDLLEPLFADVDRIQRDVARLMEVATPSAGEGQGKPRRPRRSVP